MAERAEGLACDVTGALQLSVIPCIFSSVVMAIQERGAQRIILDRSKEIGKCVVSDRFLGLPGTAILDVMENTYKPSQNWPNLS